MYCVATSPPKTQHQVIALWTAANELISSNEGAALLTSTQQQQGSTRLKPFQILKVNTSVMFVSITEAKAAIQTPSDLPGATKADQARGQTQRS